MSEFQDRYKEILKKDNTGEFDVERKTLFYILTGNIGLYQKIDRIYNFKDHSIKFDCLKTADFSSSQKKMIQLAFNLYNGIHQADVLNTFGNLDKDNFRICLNAIRIRFDMLGE